MKNWWIFAIICSFFAGSIVSGTSIFAVPDEKGNPFDDLQKQIDDIVNGNTSIKGESKMLSLGNGVSGNGILYACGKFFVDEPLTSCSQNIPLDGKITDLTASSVSEGQMLSPGLGKSYKIMLVRNGVDTVLSCVISDDDTSCQNTNDSVSVSTGDLIDIKITSVGRPDRANIAVSGLLIP